MFKTRTPASIGVVLIFFFLLVLLFSHLWTYNQSASSLSIDMQDLDNVKSLHTYLNPTVIRFIELDTLWYNAMEYHLYDPLSLRNASRVFQKEALFQPEATATLVYRNYHSVFLVRPSVDCIVRLYPPEYAKLFQRSKSIQLPPNSDSSTIYSPQHLYTCKTSESQVLASGLRIRLYDYTILYIPRRWFYQIDSKTTRVQVFTSDTLVSSWVGFITAF
jgi:hypothetical protein